MRRGAVVAGVVGIVVLAAVLSWPHTPAGRAGRVAASASPSGSAASSAPPPAPSPRASTAAPSPRASAPALPGTTLVDVDDFTGTSVDTSKWEVYEAAASNGVSQWLRSMVSVSDGELRIAGHGRSPDGVGNVSGGLCWCRGNGNQTYGIWQVRARFEAGTGYGQAILLWPESNRWPQDGELDFVETPFGPKTTAVGTVHWGADNKQDARRTKGDFTAWHTYTVEWRAGYVKMSIDSTVYYDSTTSSARPVIPSDPMQLAIQQEPGPFGRSWVPAPNGSTPDQVVMHVDWVRLYR
jgi:beta-glucanase (GH16 family)